MGVPRTTPDRKPQTPEEREKAIRLIRAQGFRYVMKETFSGSDYFDPPLLPRTVWVGCAPFMLKEIGAVKVSEIPNDGNAVEYNSFDGPLCSICRDAPNGFIDCYKHRDA